MVVVLFVAQVSFVPFQIPQHGTKDKKMKLFTSGKVGMDIHIERMGYYLGKKTNRTNES